MHITEMTSLPTLFLTPS